MNWLDIIVMVVTLVATFIGWRTGVIRAIVTLAGIGAGIYLAGQFYGDIAKPVSAFISNDNASKMVAFAAIFVVVFAAASIAGTTIKKILRLFLLGWVDSTVGGLLGLAVGSTFAAVVIVVLNSFGQEESVKASYLGSLFADNYPVVLNLLPEEFKDIGGILPQIDGADIEVQLSPNGS